jgi:hypothetical protein
MPALQFAFRIGAVLSGTAAILSAMRGQRYVHETDFMDKDTSKSGLEGEGKKEQT